MINLPISEDLPIDVLGRLFDKTSASYKLLLFKSLLEEGQNIQPTEGIRFQTLALKSLAYAYYSITQYKLRFGQADRMTVWCKNMEMIEGMSIQDLSTENIYNYLDTNNHHDEVSKYVKEFSKLVPYRLISPFFEDKLRGLKDNKKNEVIERLSKEADSKALYQINGKREEMYLILSPSWLVYLKNNYSILEGWVKFHLVNYLQLKNPTILSISTKLEPPVSRNMALVKKEFKNFFEDNPNWKRCLYSNEKLDTVSHDHYFPWSFFGSDPIYNFVPSNKAVNSSKSDSIPSHGQYFLKFVEFQWAFYRNLLSRNRKEVIEYYVNDLGLLANCTKDEFKKSLESFYKPLYLTSKNQSFKQNWKI